MPKEPLVDLSTINLEKAAFPIEKVREFNPQRYEMEQLSYIATCDLDTGCCVAVRKISPDEFWCRGHIPGRPLFPGVLMVEAAAQLCSFHYHRSGPEDTRFFGFGAVDAVKFRGEVVPGDTLVLVSRIVEMRPRRSVFETQGFVADRMVFEGRITGMPM